MFWNLRRPEKLSSRMTLVVERTPKISQEACVCGVVGAASQIFPQARLGGNAPQEQRWGVSPRARNLGCKGSRSGCSLDVGSPKVSDFISSPENCHHLDADGLGV